MPDLSVMKLGKRPVKLDKRTLKLSTYIKELIPPPVKSSYVQLVPRWPMMLNDMLGDCVIAAMGHVIQQQTTYASGKAFVPSDSAILKGYMDVGGYQPGNPFTDNGCVMLDALKYWRKTGIAGHKILAFATLKLGNMNELKQAITLFGNVYLGVDLPVTAQYQDKCWSVVPDAGAEADPLSWGGHCVNCAMYDPAIPEEANSTIGFVSWGQLMYMTTAFYRRYVSEAYVVLSQDWIEQNGVSPSGFDLTTLLSDLDAVTHA